MNKRLTGVMLLAIFLAACAAKPVKEEPAAAVEEKSPMTTQEAPAPAAPMEQSASSAATSEAPVTVNPLTDPNNILSKRSVYFDFDKDEVKSDYRPMLEAHAKYLKDHPAARVTLQGNTDERGSREYNLALGQRRAVAVKNVMNVYGASDSQIETVSYGEEKPRCADHAESCWTQNRRADVVYAGE